MISEKSVRVDGLNVHYLEAGENHPRSLLLLHGGMGDAWLHWSASIEALAEDFHVFAPHLPGFGKSDALPRMRTEALLNWLRSFLRTVGVEQAVLIGNAHGGLLARLYASAYPQDVPALVLVNGGGVPDVPGLMRFLERIPLISNLVFGMLGRTATSPTTLKQMIHAEDVLTDDFIKQVQASGKSFSRLMRMFFASPMPKAQTPLVPALILWGASDQVATLADAQAIKDSIPGSAVTEIADCGHMPQLETMDVFVWQVNTFLESLSRPTRTDLPGAGMLPKLPS
jgi:pimeloyl-ACP methyl ester carboxylesterase